ncbi:MAG: MAPEG family protein [Rhodospirillales bacterium]|nr:MAPEG family protein [Rhodospirillales bacterium]
MITVTPIYLALAVVLYSIMTFIIIANRNKRRISIGDGAQQDFSRLIRGHANFAEFAPITLLAIVIAELSGAPATVLHICGIALIIGRSLHAYCFLCTPSGLKYRVSGMVLTLLSLWMSTGAAVWMIFVH